MIDSQTIAATMNATRAPGAGTSTSRTGTPGGTLGKDDFLRLLVTQLRNQDPLNPLDQNQFLSQTAQFSSLEELQNIGQSIDALRAANDRSALGQAAGLLGHTARVSGRDVTYDGRTPPSLAFTLSGSAASVQVQVLDQQGNVVRQISGGALDPGAHSVTWDGLDNAGQPLAAGSYFYHVTATGAAGAAAPTAVAAAGAITGLETRDGRTVYRLGQILVRQDDIVDVQ